MNDDAIQTFYIGYIPKDLALNVSQLLDHVTTFQTENLTLVTNGAKSVLDVSFTLSQEILDLHSVESGEVFHLKTLAAFPMALKTAI